MQSTVESIGIAALKNSFTRYQKLGVAGKDQVNKNQYGDSAMKGDIEAEAAVLEILKQSKLPLTVYSEEHGKVDLSDKPEYLAVLDGIDGSHWYMHDWHNGRYGTMLGIFRGANPLYRDYLFGGIMEHATQRLFYGAVGKGSHILHHQTGKDEVIHVSNAQNLGTNTKIHIDEYWDINNEVFTSKLKGFNVSQYYRCSSYHYADTAMGAADLTLECTRKGNLEIAAAYPLIMEAGGVIVSIEGENLENKAFLSFGQDIHIPIITASTKKLGASAVAFFK